MAERSTCRQGHSWKYRCSCRSYRSWRCQRDQPGTGLRIRVVLLQVLDREYIWLGTGGDIAGHLLVVVVGRVFLDLDGDVRVLLLECLSKVREFRTRIKRPACQRDFRLGVFIQRLT